MEFKKEDEEAHGKKHHHLFYHHKVEDKHHNYSEHLGELGNGAASAYSLVFLNSLSSYDNFFFWIAHYENSFI